MPAPFTSFTTEPFRLGEVRFDRVTQQQALDNIAQLVAARRGGFVVTPNVDHVVLAAEDARLPEVYHGAALSLADGQPVMWMARLLGTPLPEKVSGSDLIDPLMATAARLGWRVFLFGATPEVSARAEQRLRERHGALRIVGRDTSRWDPSEGLASEVTEAIRRVEADLVVVALGCPKQELWMARHAAAIAPALAIGLGGSLDFVAGAVARAPGWVSSLGFEWLYRLAQEPRRLAYRYLVRDTRIIPILGRALLARWRARRAARPGSNAITLEQEPVRS